MKFQQPDLNSELSFSTSRSSGKGGQHVNKTESRVSLFFNVIHNEILSEKEKETLLRSPYLKLSKEGILQIDAESSRSQFKNKQEVIRKFYELINKALLIPKARKLSKPSKASIRKRLKSKKILSEKKKNRKKPF